MKVGFVWHLLLVRRVILLTEITSSRRFLVRLGTLDRSGIDGRDLDFGPRRLMSNDRHPFLQR